MAVKRVHIQGQIEAKRSYLPPQPVVREFIVPIQHTYAFTAAAEHIGQKVQVTGTREMRTEMLNISKAVVVIQTTCTLEDQTDYYYLAGVADGLCIIENLKWRTK